MAEEGTGKGFYGVKEGNGTWNNFLKEKG